MCSKIAPPCLKPPTTTTAVAVIKKETATAAVKIKPPPARKIKGKTRKRKYLSLLLELSPENTPHSSPHMTTANAATTTTATSTSDHHHQLNLFPLHPENLMEDKLDTHDHNMAASFFPTTDGDAAATLTGLLSVSTSEEAEDTTLSPSSMNYEEGDLVRTAMRNKERDASEEKWVSYSEVVEKKEEEVSSSTAAIAVEERRCKLKGLSLKLDYNEIMNAWSDKGPLYILSESPQTVPDLGDDDFLSSSSAAVNGLWSVPEMSETNVSDGKLESSWSKTSLREASVQRYKEKRQSRLFAKKIRYQVRKLNAEKRPRIKGRFVKRG